jgi:hypothetical protein
MDVGTTEITIRITSRGKTLAVLTGRLANIVDKAMAQVAIAIAEESG